MKSLIVSHLTSNDHSPASKRVSRVLSRSGSRSGGFSVIELLVSIGAAGMAIAALTTAVIFSTKFIVSSQDSANNVVNLNLMRVHLSKIRNRAFHKPVFLNQQVINTLLGSGASVGSISGDFSSIVPFRNRALRPIGGGRVEIVPSAGHAVGLILSAQRSSILRVSPDPTRPGLPYDFSDPDMTTGRLYHSGSNSVYSVGDLIAINTSEAVQIVRLASSGPGWIQFNTIGKYDVGFSQTSMPLGLVSLRSAIYRLDTYLIGMTENAKQIRLVRIDGSLNHSIPMRINGDVDLDLNYVFPPTPTDPQNRGSAPFSGELMLVMKYSQTDKLGMVSNSELKFRF